MNPEEWADAGLEEVARDLDDFALPLTLEQASLFIRAAYVRGWLDANGVVDPLPVLEAMRRRDELALRVPVS